MNNERLRENILELAKLMDGLYFNYTPDRSRKLVSPTKFSFRVFHNYILSFGDGMLIQNSNDPSTGFFNHLFLYLGFSKSSLLKSTNLFNKVKSFLFSCKNVEGVRLINLDIATNLFYSLCWYKLERIKHGQSRFSIFKPCCYFPSPQDLLLPFINLHQMLDLGISYDIALYFCKIRQRKLTKKEGVR